MFYIETIEKNLFFFLPCLYSFYPSHFRYACSWRRLSPSTDGVSGEAKDLWIFYFATIPDLTGKLAPELQGETTIYSKQYLHDVVIQRKVQVLGMIIHR